MRVEVPTERSVLPKRSGIPRWRSW